MGVEQRSSRPVDGVGSETPIRILYIYDVDGWALYNVGLLWFSGAAESEATFTRADRVTAQLLREHDVVWFGYLDLYLECCSRLRVSWNDLRRCVVAIHDPSELFEYRPVSGNHQRRSGPTSILASLRRRCTWRLLAALHVVVISQEMCRALRDRGIYPDVLSTMPSIPSRDASDVTTTRCSVLSVFHDYPRKNRAMLERVKRRCEASGVPFTLKVGRERLSEAAYVQLFDRHSIYVCTSTQEGGPLPAMEAMARGAVVVSSRVGQLPEIIEDGMSGFFCESEDDFVAVISRLSANVDELHRARLASLAAIRGRRSEEALKQKARSIVGAVCRASRSTTYRAGHVRWERDRIAYRLLTMALNALSDATNRGTALKRGMRGIRG